MKILLICPVSEHDINKSILRELPFMRAEAFFAPHACAVVAALTPREHDVRIHDENLHGPVDVVLERETFDVVGISLVSNELKRAIAIARCFRQSRQKGVLVAGGAGMLHMLSRLGHLLDVAFVGEAEETWPRFLKELEEGRHERLYRQIAKPDLTASPVPRWELIGEDLRKYSVASVQTTRGCPYDCSFCDVIYTYGRKLRSKSIDQVIEEVRTLEGLGSSMIYFADDNFTANRGYAKELLRRLAEINRSFNARVTFATQADITIARDGELLQLMLDANMLEVQIGIESIDQASLEDIRKAQNLRLDLVQAVRKIQSYGIVVLAHMIFGIDSDDYSAFARTERFLEAADIVHHSSHPLMAPPGTKLWYALRRERRLVNVSDEMYDRMDLNTNVVPKRMSRAQLIEGLARHRRRTSEPEHFLPRALRFVRGVSHRPTVPVENEPSTWRMRKTLLAMLRFYLVDAGPRERMVFLELFLGTALHRPELISRAMYALVCHTMERRHAQITSGWAREIIAGEEAIPGGLEPLAPSTEIAEGIRQNAKEIVGAAYRRTRREVAGRDALYQIVVEALTDYAERFGETFGSFDERQRDGVEKSCERCLATMPRRDRAGDLVTLPEDAPPPGFHSEIIDAVDQTMRFGLTSRKPPPAPSVT